MSSTLTPRLVLALLGLVACDGQSKDAPVVTNERSQSVVAKNPQPIAAAATIPIAAKAAEVSKKPLALKPVEPARAFPKKSPSRAASSDASPVPATLAVGGGKWTWVNYWAAWCAPCKEEIPRLLGWQKKLENEHFRVQFVSLDDDERQLKEFLNAQPAGGLRASYWLKEGNEREEFLRAVPASDASALPFHWLVDPKGKIAFTIAGAVEDADLAEVSAIIAKGR